MLKAHPLKYEYERVGNNAVTNQYASTIEQNKKKYRLQMLGVFIVSSMLRHQLLRKSITHFIIEKEFFVTWV